MRYERRFTPHIHPDASESAYDAEIRRFKRYIVSISLPRKADKLRLIKRRIMSSQCD
jgi:hypothetical protein